MQFSDKQKEFFRFIICGILATIVDYLFSQLLIMVLPKSINSTLITVISSSVGFIISVLLNYVLSTYWVYKNVDENINTKSPLFVFLFALFSVVAMLAALAFMSLCQFLCNYLLNINIVDASVIELIKDDGIKFLINGIFWAYAISFVLKTFLSLFINYVTRKYLLYREPKIDK